MGRHATPFIILIGGQGPRIPNRTFQTAANDLYREGALATKSDKTDETVAFSSVGLQNSYQQRYEAEARADAEHERVQGRATKQQETAKNGSAWY
ncbi:MAG: hypothetical protein EA424_26120 [Planctomycetaceae bacterium]|nr:MAG: hypothetical protein EA424_26120 [Planctomycetaceae bacterium]